jgi:hypothetical protein
MGRSKIYPKILLVEGDNDKRVIPEFIEQNGILWELNPQEYIVKIKAKDSKENLLSQTEIKTELKASGLEALGIVVDADENPQTRKQRIEQIYESLGKNLNDNLSDNGLIFQLNSGIKFGIWMMPNNYNQGMLETFLSYLIEENNPNDNSLWQYVEEVVVEASKRGATYKEVHLDKAKIHTWLAWQDEPGNQLHQAIKYKIFNSSHPKGQSFFVSVHGGYEVNMV